jgi:hypothetical protein
MAPIFFADPGRQVFFIFLQHVHGAVLGTAIADKDFHAGIVLVQDAGEGVLDVLTLVERGDHHADLGEIHKTRGWPAV